jgi:hypothetical protein
VSRAIRPGRPVKRTHVAIPRRFRGDEDDDWDGLPTLVHGVGSAGGFDEDDDPGPTRVLLVPDAGERHGWREHPVAADDDEAEEWPGIGFRYRAST